MNDDQRKSLARTAYQRSLRVRHTVGVKLHQPVCIYDLVEKLKVDIWFRPLPSIEGMYYKNDPGHIILSSLRPPGRQAFTCAHELGHHVFGHGDRIDELLEESSDIEEEYLADSFAAFTLMPKSAVDNAFAARGWNSKNPEPKQVYIVAGYLGVGYETLANQLAGNLGIITWDYAKSLKRLKRKTIREKIIGMKLDNDLTVVDEQWVARSVDIQVGTYVLAPFGTQYASLRESIVLEYLGASVSGEVFKAIAPGRGRIAIDDSDWAAFVRVAKSKYEGRSKYMYLEDPDYE